MNAIERYGCILHEEWKASDRDGIIIGYWAEDGGEYNIIVPNQLRDSLISMQNALSKKYKQTEKLKKDLKDALNDIHKILE